MPLFFPYLLKDYQTSAVQCCFVYSVTGEISILTLQKGTYALHERSFSKIHNRGTLNSSVYQLQK